MFKLFQNLDMFFTILLFSVICSSFSDLIGIPPNPVFDGDSLILVCEKGKYYYSTYKWYRNGDKRHSGHQYVNCASSENKYCFSVNRLYIKYVQFEYDNGVTWRCDVDRRKHEYVISVGSARVTKTILSTSSVVNEELILTRPGDNVTFQCSTDKVIPLPKVWLCMTRQNTHTCSEGLVQSSSNRLSITKTVNAGYPSSSYSVYCAATNSEVLVMSDQVTIKEYEAPKLSISLSQNNGRVFIYCTVINKSQNVTFLPWIHNNGNEYIRDINSTWISRNSSYIEILKNSSSDAGTYICSASNGFKDKTTHEYKQFASHTVTFDSVEFHEERQENKSVNVGENVELYSLFSSDDFDVTWYHNDSQMTLTNHTTFSVEYSTIPNHYNASVRIAAKKTVLKIKGVDITDAGFYYCSICSSKVCLNSSVKYMSVNIRTMPSTATVTVREVPSAAIGGILFLVFLLLAVSTLLAIVLYQWKTLQRDVSERKSKPAPVLEIFENNMYVSGDENLSYPDKDIEQNAGMEIPENEYYVSQDENATFTRNSDVKISAIESNGNGVVYAQVNKGNTKKPESTCETTKEGVYCNISTHGVYTNY